ncbi:hypothetical protein [Acinetobacter sp. WZC-1]|uniref:hypothetical protein n=1 Tax=Acinetobacter sp. WZC-1 TaxID=3459034 RepID=UPI00403DDAE3
MTHPLVEQLIEAHLKFLEQEFSQSDQVQTEFLHFYDWFKKQSLHDLWSFEQINHLIQQQILATPANDFLMEQITAHIHLALTHPANDHTLIEDIIPVTTIDKIALYIAGKSAHRKALIKRMVNNPSFSTMLSQLIHHSIQDYIDNSVMSKKVPGVGRFMKMGKSVLESVTDSNLDDTVKHYLQKNIIKISQLSEQVINQQFDDNQLYHLQASLWHKIKKVPLSSIHNYVEIHDLPQTVGLGHEIWDHIRQTDYLRKQVQDGIFAWYTRNQQRSFELLLTDLNIDENLIQHQLQDLLAPVIQQMVSSVYLKDRARYYLEKFYYSDQAQHIFTQMKKGA